MVVGPGVAEVASAPRRSPMPPAEEQIPKITEDLVADLLLLLCTFSAERCPQGNPEVKHEYGDQCRERNEDPGDDRAGFRYEAEQEF
jgi:hypothetical protein